MPARSLAFGPFRLDLDSGTLFRDGEMLALGRKAALLLAAMASRPGEPVTKADLMDAAWPGATVEESNLSVQVAALRKVLGRRPDGREWIATVPRVGYRLLGEARSTTPGEPGPGTVLPSLAVLPFETPGGDRSDDYFADGIVEDIITALSRFRSFAVVARSASFVYRDRASDVRAAARELGVRYVLAGSLRRSGGRLRITTQLVDGESGIQLWADRFDGAIEDIFDAQDRITEQTIGIVEPQIRRAEIERSRRKRPEHFDAYDFYLQALSRMDRPGEENNTEAYALAVRAMTIEPDHGPFRAVAVWALTRHVTMGWRSLTGDDRATALDLARRTLDLAEGDPAVMAQCGFTLLGLGRDYRQGMQVIANALAANPNNFLVLTCAAVAELHCGDVEQSLRWSRRVLQLSPGAPTAHIATTAIAHAHMVLGQPAEALDAAAQAIAINAAFQPTLWILAAANAGLGRMDEARHWLDALRRLAPGVTIAGIAAGQPAFDPDRLAPILDGLRKAGLEES